MSTVYKLGSNLCCQVYKWNKDAICSATLLGFSELLIWTAVLYGLVTSRLVVIDDLHPSPLRHNDRQEPA